MKHFLLLIALVSMTIACSPPTAAPEADRAPADSGIAVPQRCTNAKHGFSVSYPEGWHTNSGAVIPACSAFHPDPFEIPEASEMPFEIVITISVEPVAIESLRTTSQWEQIVSAERLTIGSREAWRIEVRSTGEGLAHRGMRTMRYAIDLGEGRTLLASTHSAAGAEYPLNQEILAAMVESIELPR